MMPFATNTNRPSNNLLSRFKLRALLFLLCYTISILRYTFKYSNQFHFHPDEWTYDPSIQQRAHYPSNPSDYLHSALTGPRRCPSSPCYIVDVVADPYQPRIFLSMLGLPATDMAREARGNVTRISMVDVRTGDRMDMKQSLQLVNDTHSYAVLLSMQNGYVMTLCEVLKQKGLSLNAFAESMTYTCDFKEPIANDTPMQVDVLLAPWSLGATWGMGIDSFTYLNLNGVDTPFYVSAGAKTSGLFNSVSRRDTMKPLSMRETENSAMYQIPRVAACLIGVNYASTQQREVIQYYLTIGFGHIYIGLPLWPTSTLFREMWEMLQDFVHEGSLSIIVSEYAGEFIEPERFGRNFTYAPSGHKSSYVNTCLLASRSAGDDLAFVGDMDELVEFKYGNATTIGEAIMWQLSTKGMTLSQLCEVNLGAIGGFYHEDLAGYTNTARIENKLAAVGNVSDSVATYGKSILNVKRVLRAGVHSAAYCEAPSVPGLENVTRPSHIDETNTFRPDIEDIRILHLTDSYKKRSAPWMINNAKEGEHFSYYIRDFSGLVHGRLEERKNKRNKTFVDN